MSQISEHYIKNRSRYHNFELCTRLNYVYTSRQCEDYFKYLEELRAIIFGKDYKFGENMTETMEEKSINYHTHSGKTLVYQFENTSHYGISLSPIPSETETTTTETYFAEEHVLPKASASKIIPVASFPSALNLCHQLPIEIQERMNSCLNISSEVLNQNFLENHNSLYHGDNSSYWNTTPPYGKQDSHFDSLNSPRLQDYYHTTRPEIVSNENDFSEDDDDYGDSECFNDHIDENFAVLEDFATVLEESESVFEEVDDYTEILEDYVVTNEEVMRAVLQINLPLLPEDETLGESLDGDYYNINVQYCDSNCDSELGNNCSRFLPSAFSRSSCDTVIRRNTDSTDDNEPASFVSEEQGIESVPILSASDNLQTSSDNFVPQSSSQDISKIVKPNMHVCGEKLIHKEEETRSEPLPVLFAFSRSSSEIEMRRSIDFIDDDPSNFEIKEQCTESFLSSSSPTNSQFSSDSHIPNSSALDISNNFKLDSTVFCEDHFHEKEERSPERDVDTTDLEVINPKSIEPLTETDNVLVEMINDYVHMVLNAPRPLIPTNNLREDLEDSRGNVFVAPSFNKGMETDNSVSENQETVGNTDFDTDLNSALLNDNELQEVTPMPVVDEDESNTTAISQLLSTVNDVLFSEDQIQTIEEHEKPENCLPDTKISQTASWDASENLESPETKVMSPSLEDQQDQDINHDENLQDVTPIPIDNEEPNSTTTSHLLDSTIEKVVFAEDQILTIEEITNLENCLPVAKVSKTASLEISKNVELPPTRPNVMVPSLKDEEGQDMNLQEVPQTPGNNQGESNGTTISHLLNTVVDGIISAEDQIQTIEEHEKPENCLPVTKMSQNASWDVSENLEFSETNVTVPNLENQQGQNMNLQEITRLPVDNGDYSNVTNNSQLPKSIIDEIIFAEDQIQTIDEQEQFENCLPVTKISQASSLEVLENVDSEAVDQKKVANTDLDTNFDCALLNAMDIQEVLQIPVDYEESNGAIIFHLLSTVVDDIVFAEGHIQTIEENEKSGNCLSDTTPQTSSLEVSENLEALETNVTIPNLEDQYDQDMNLQEVPHVPVVYEDESNATTVSQLVNTVIDGVISAEDKIQEIEEIENFEHFLSDKTPQISSSSVSKNVECSETNITIPNLDDQHGQDMNQNECSPETKKTTMSFLNHDNDDNADGIVIETIDSSHGIPDKSVEIVPVIQGISHFENYDTNTTSFADIATSLQKFLAEKGNMDAQEEVNSNVEIEENSKILDETKISPISVDNQGNDSTEFAVFNETGRNQSSLQDNILPGDKSQIQNSEFILDASQSEILFENVTSGPSNDISEPDTNFTAIIFQEVQDYDESLPDLSLPVIESSVETVDTNESQTQNDTFSESTEGIEQQQNVVELEAPIETDNAIDAIEPDQYNKKEEEKVVLSLDENGESTNVENLNDAIDPVLPSAPELSQSDVISENPVENIISSHSVGSESTEIVPSNQDIEDVVQSVVEAILSTTESSPQRDDDEEKLILPETENGIRILIEAKDDVQANDMTTTDTSKDHTTVPLKDDVEAPKTEETQNLEDAPFSELQDVCGRVSKNYEEILITPADTSEDHTTAQLEDDVETPNSEETPGIKDQEDAPFLELQDFCGNVNKKDEDVLVTPADASEEHVSAQLEDDVETSKREETQDQKNASFLELHDVCGTVTNYEDLTRTNDIDHVELPISGSTGEPKVTPEVEAKGNEETEESSLDHVLINDVVQTDNKGEDDSTDQPDLTNQQVIQEDVHLHQDASESQRNPSTINYNDVTETNSADVISLNSRLEALLRNELRLVECVRDNDEEPQDHQEQAQSEDFQSTLQFFPAETDESQSNDSVDEKKVEEDTTSDSTSIGVFHTERQWSTTENEYTTSEHPTEIDPSREETTEVSPQKVVDEVQPTTETVQNVYPSVEGTGNQEQIAPKNEGFAYVLDKDKQKETAYFGEKDTEEDTEEKRSVKSSAELNDAIQNENTNLYDHISTGFCNSLSSNLPPKEIVHFDSQVDAPKQTSTDSFSCPSRETHDVKHTLESSHTAPPRKQSQSEVDVPNVDRSDLLPESSNCSVCTDSVPTNASPKQFTSNEEESLNPLEQPNTFSVIEEVSHFLSTACIAALAFASPSENIESSSSFNTDIIEDVSKYISSEPKQNADNSD